MIYRKLGNTGFNASLLGMGCMRLPYIDDADMTKGVDRQRAYEMIRHAVEQGVNYFDTAKGYHGGDSEAVLGEALDHNGMREKVWITTKHPFWQPCAPDQIRRNLEETLKKLRTDYLDTYLMHGIGPGSWPKILEWNIWGEFEKFKAEGLIRHIGFSYHGNFAHFKEVVAHYPWELCLVMHNILDVNREVTAEGIAIAAEKGIAVTIMEPLRGGGLCTSPKPVAAVYDAFPVKHSPTEWAFRYLANLPGVASITSGISSMAQLEENLAIFSQPDMTPGHMTPDEEKLIVAARKAYESVVTIPCTRCNYCMPCPQNVNISNIFNQYNDGHRFEFFNQVRRSYMFARRGGSGADKCTQCGVCIEKCPAGIDIPAQLKTAHAKLDGWEE
ncbi:MAG: aldo/keto reductase [Defluviitaleaceae bacterium]|nr:aldo/keto reductase [Defluviitaleaceae bacterium]MCL2239920.1 aldo/keto reductase [Defluviitaleaceae bacterium]